MKELIFATNNAHKLEEINDMFASKEDLQSKYEIKALSSLNFNEDIPEEADTIRDNAFEKANFIYNKFGCNCFADDTGLQVPILNNVPGIYSARYANMPDDFEITAKASKESLLLAPPTFLDNINRLLNKMQGLENEDRQAEFVSVICLILNGNPYFFEGKVKGYIIDKKIGKGGFGYDPVFVPTTEEFKNLNYNVESESFKPKSFAELLAAEKNAISHRGRAFRSMLDFLANY